MARALVLLDSGEVLWPEHLPALNASARRPATFRGQVRMFKVELSLEVLRQEGWMTGVARRLGMSPCKLNKLCSD